MADKSTALVGSSAIYVLMGSIRLLAGKYCSKLWRDISRKKTLLVIFFDAEILFKPIVPKSPASSPEERLRIKVFRESGFYYPKLETFVDVAIPMCLEFPNTLKKLAH